MSKAAKCLGCPLNRGRPVQGSGPVPCGLMLVGEAPGSTETNTGVPFSGASGQELDQYLSHAGIVRDHVYATNVVKCQPPGNRDPKEAEIRRCIPALYNEILDCNPKVIATVGAVSSRSLIPGFTTLEAEHGIPRPVFMPMLGRDVTVVPTYHPAYGMRNTATMSMIALDFEAAVAALHDTGAGRPIDLLEGYESYGTGITVTNDGMPDLPGMGQPEWWPNELGTDRIVVAVDTESTPSGPWCLSISSEPGTSRVVMVDDRPGIEAVARLLSDEATTTILHNAAYDIPVLDAMGINPSHFIDTMIMAYHLQVHPQALKLLAWRLCGMGMSDYTEVVSGATRAKSTAYLEAASILEWPDPEPLLIWDKGSPRVKQPQNIGRKIQRILQDVKCKGADPYARWYNIKPQDGRAQVEEVLGLMQSGNLSDVPLGQAVYYSARDADATIRVAAHLSKEVSALDLWGPVLLDCGTVPIVTDMERAGIMIDRPYMESLGKEFDVKMATINSQIDVIAGEHINPASSPQVADLLFKKLRLPHATSIKASSSTGSPSTRDEILTQIKDYHPVVALIRQWRDYQKLRTSYVDALLTKADPTDDRVHTTLRITRVVTGRLASSNPNLMAQPSRSKEGRRLKAGFIAGPGRSIVHADYSQIEMRLVAHESRDPEMCGMFLRGDDIHSVTASRIFGVPIPELDKMKHRYPAKRVGFGILNGLTPEGLLEQLVLGGCHGWDIPACKELIDEWFSLFPGIKRYFSHKRAEARRLGYVRDMGGRIRLIPEVYSAMSWTRDAGYRQACSAVIQSAAQFVIKSAMRDLTPVYRGIDAHGHFCKPLIQVHDALLFEVDDETLDWYVPVMVSYMETAVPLCIPTPVDVEIGRSWGHVEDEAEAGT